jgi:DNA-3-methyladenine glycosylase I
VKYHDEEWGVPVTDDRKLFEFIVLESAQAGLSWITILKRREGYRKAFKNFEVKKVAAMGEEDIERLMQDSSIIRNRMKIAATIKNAQAFMAVQKEFGSFANYFWGFVDGTPIQNKPGSMSDVPAVTPLAVTMAKDLKKRGFSFLGPTIWYAHMQACGMVNDHVGDCFREREVRQLGKAVVLS